VYSSNRNDMNVRDFASKNSMALLYATVGLVVILLAVWALPSFHSRGVGSWCGGMGERYERFDGPRGRFRQEQGQGNGQRRAAAPNVNVQTSSTDESVPDYGSPAPTE
jgi:hypothetical protein